jgi:hypothetical protein
LNIVLIPTGLVEHDDARGILSCKQGHRNVRVSTDNYDTSLLLGLRKLGKL